MPSERRLRILERLVGTEAPELETQRLCEVCAGVTGMTGGGIMLMSGLMPTNLNRYFAFDAYGSDSADRAELTRLAIDKATRLHNHLAPAQLYSTADLRDAGAAHVLGSLEDRFPGL